MDITGWQVSIKQWQKSHSKVHFTVKKKTSSMDTNTFQVAALDYQVSASL